MKEMIKGFGFKMSPREYYEHFKDWLDDEASGFVLREDAPEDVRRIFDEYKEARRKSKEAGYFID